MNTRRPICDSSSKYSYALQVPWLSSVASDQQRAVVSVVLGCDPSTKCVALATSDGDVGSIVIAPMDKGPRRLGDVFHRTKILCRQTLNGRVPETCWVETPRGRVHPSLWQVYGVIQAALYEAMSSIAAHPVSVLTIGPTEWKARAFGAGHGHASKDEIAAWCVAQGYSFDSQDEADALAIAYAGRLMTGGV